MIMIINLKRMQCDHKISVCCGHALVVPLSTERLYSGHITGDNGNLATDELNLHSPVNAHLRKASLNCIRIYDWLNVRKRPVNLLMFFSHDILE